MKLVQEIVDELNKLKRSGQVAPKKLRNLRDYVAAVSEDTDDFSVEEQLDLMDCLTELEILIEFSGEGRD